MSQNPLLQQLVSPIVVRPEDMKTPEQAAKVLRLVQDTMGQAFQRLQNLINTDPRLNDSRNATSLYGMAHNIQIIDRAKGSPGDILTLVDQYNCVFASSGNPGPGGVTPTGATPHALLDGSFNNDTVAQAPSRGSLIYGNSTPKWDELVKPSVPSVLKNDATDAAWVTIPTRRLWIPAAEWLANVSGAVPDLNRTGLGVAYSAWILADAVDSEINATVEVPDNWVSGAITAKAHWTTAVKAAQNWVPHLYWLERVDGDDMLGAASHIAGPTTSANFDPHILKITTVGTFTPTGAGKLLRLVFARLASSDANDTYTDDINFIGVELSFTPSY